jgi:hypothetical protein
VTLRLYMDEHVPRAITTGALARDGLRARRLDVMTTEEGGHAGSIDSELIERASSPGRVLVSFDYDMFREAAARRVLLKTFAGILHIRGSISIGRCIDEVHLVCEAMSQEEVAGNVIRLPL